MNEICSIHGKRRVVGDLQQLPSGEFRCVHGKGCFDERTCAVHNWQRRLPDLIEQSNGTYVCTPRRPCNTGGGGVHRKEQYRPQQRRFVWCQTHGRFISSDMCDYIDNSYYICRDQRECLAMPLPARPGEDAPPGSGLCPPVFCAIHGVLRTPDFLTLNSYSNAYKCIDGHACREQDTRGS